MSKNEDLWFGLVYYLLYAPLSFVIWYFNGAESLLEFIVAQCIGVFIFFLYLVMNVVFEAFMPVRRIIARPVASSAQVPIASVQEEKVLVNSEELSTPIPPNEPSPPPSSPEVLTTALVEVKEDETIDLD